VYKKKTEGEVYAYFERGVHGMFLIMTLIFVRSREREARERPLKGVKGFNE
jgi:hypothetical protein